MVNTAIYNVYKTSTGLYVPDSICNTYNVGRKEEQKEIKGINCYKVNEQDVESINEQSSHEETRLMPNYISLFDLQLVLSFTVYKDTKHDNKLYISDSTCEKYEIEPISKRIINNFTYCNVTEEDINKIEEKTKNEKIALKRKYEEISLDDEVKPANHLFIYFLDYETNKKYIKREIFELARKNEIEIEGTPKIINNKNCYSLTDEQLKELESKTDYRGVEQIIRISPDSIEKELNKTKEQLELLVNNNEEKVSNSNKTEKSDKDTLLQNEINKIKEQLELLINNDEEKVSNSNKTKKSDKDTLLQNELNKTKEQLELLINNDEDNASDNKIENIDNSILQNELNKTKEQLNELINNPNIAYNNNEIENVIIYKDKKTNKLYAPFKTSEDQEPITILNKTCYETKIEDLEAIKDKKIIIISIYPVEKKTYDVIICNNKGQFYVSKNILDELGFYIENPHKILVNKEVYEEIVEEDIELIRAKESDSCHINIIEKQITPKRG